MYNIFRWYRAGWGRYTQADPIGLEGGLNLFSYAAGNPIIAFDPDGLSPCQKDPALVNCDTPDSGCCVAKCLDDLRFSVCMLQRFRPAFKVIGALGGMSAGIKLGGKIGGIIGGPPGLVKGACIGGVAGAGLGATGLWRSYYGLQWALTKGGQYRAFSDCMKKCGSSCDPDKDCQTKDLFDHVVNGN